MLEKSPHKIECTFDGLEDEQKETIFRTIIGLILPFCNLKLRCFIRSASRWHHSLIDSDKNVPFLTKADSALAALNLEWNFMLAKKINPKIQYYNRLRFSVTDNAQPGGILLTQRSKFAYYNPNKSHVTPAEPDTIISIKIDDVIKAITDVSIPKRRTSYFFLESRQRRHEFIMDMINSSKSDQMIRNYLRGQPLRSLSRLDQSLGRYQNPSFQPIKKVVHDLIQQRVQMARRLDY